MKFKRNILTSTVISSLLLLTSVTPISANTGAESYVSSSSQVGIEPCLIGYHSSIKILNSNTWCWLVEDTNVLPAKITCWASSGPGKLKFRIVAIKTGNVIDTSGWLTPSAAASGSWVQSDYMGIGTNFKIEVMADTAGEYQVNYHD